jgi:hypothetical protein
MGIEGPHAGPVWISGSTLVAHLAAGIFGMLVTGGGHGMYAPLVLFFPYAMLAAATQVKIAWVFALLVGLQPIAYSVLLSVAEARDVLKRMAVRVGVVHLAVAIIAAVFAVARNQFPLLRP